MIHSTMFGTIWGAPAHMVVLAIVLSIIYVGLIIRFILHMRSIGKKRSTILLLGPLNGGKTTLFHTLRDGAFIDTVTSMKEQDETFVLHSKFNVNKTETPLHVVDFPGHERLRMRVADFYPIASRIVFVIDASDARSFRKAAEFLHDLFSNAKINDLTPPILIACNKSDLSNASSPQVIREALEKELTQLKTTRSSLETEGDEQDANSDIPVGRDGIAFDFEIDSPCDVSFIKCSVKDQHVQDILSFLEQN